MTDKILIERAVLEQALDALQDAETVVEHRQDIELRRSAMVALRAALEQPVEQEPVAAQCRFKGEAEWRHCTVAHHLHVQAHPKEWPHYETRALYTHPQNLSCKSNQARLATLWGYVKEQPPVVELEPALVISFTTKGSKKMVNTIWNMREGTTLYTHPQPRQPLTDEQIVKTLKDCDRVPHDEAGWVWKQRIKWARAIEKAHGIGSES